MAALRTEPTRRCRGQHHSAYLLVDVPNRIHAPDLACSTPSLFSGSVAWVIVTVNHPPDGVFPAN